MAGTVARRPLPALISLVALLILTALVWWRVINRDTTPTARAHTCTTTSAGPHASPTATLPPASTVKVTVLNATSRTGIAGQARTALVHAGFASPDKAGNYTGKATISGVGQIRYPRASAAAASLVGYYLPGATLVPTSDASASVTVVLGPKYRSVRSPAEVASALAAARATQPGSPAPSSTPTAC